MFATTRTRYGLRAICCLARRQGALTSSREIAVEEGIPRRYLQSLLRDLAAAGLLQVVRGRTGGYRLAKEASHISIAAISEAVGDPLTPIFCLGCRRAELGCAAHQAWKRLGEEFRRVLSRTTVAQLCPPLRAPRSRPPPHRPS